MTESLKQREKGRTPGKQGRKKMGASVVAAVNKIEVFEVAIKKKGVKTLILGLFFSLRIGKEYFEKGGKA